MPQSVEELGRAAKRKRPGVYDDISDTDLGRAIKRKYPGAYDDFTEAPAQQGTLGAIGSGIAEGVIEHGARPAMALADALGSAAGGDFGPLKNMVEAAGRGAMSVAGYLTAGAPADPKLAELRAQREQREQQLNQTPAGQFVQRKRVELAAEAARDQTRGNKIARGVGRFIGAAAPAVATGVLTGGSVPAIAATTALQSAAQPEGIVPAAAVGALPLPVGQAVRGATNAIRRVFGKGAAQIIEAEAGPAIAQAAPAVEQAAAPAVATNASPTVERAMHQFEQAVTEINA